MTKPSAPERIEYLLPPRAATIDGLQRRFLDHMQAFGYQLVTPPLADDIGALLDGADETLGALTLRLTDPLGGAPIGIRADITPQVRGIDANWHARGQGGINRLCYCGPTLHTRPTKPWLNREQLQAGAELFGGDALAGIVEVTMLALGCLERLGITDAHVALGHAGLSQALLAGVDPVAARTARRHLAKRDQTSLAELADTLGPVAGQLVMLATMQGDAEVLERIAALDPGNQGLAQAQAGLASMHELLADSQVGHSFDLASLSGFEYHTGVTFVILAGEEVVIRGGAYGGTDRPAAGFSLDLRNLPVTAPDTAREQVAAVRDFGNPAWRAAVGKLADGGQDCVLVDGWDEVPTGCTSRLVADGDRWEVRRDG